MLGSVVPRLLFRRSGAVNCTPIRAFSFSWKELDGVIRDDEIAKIRASVMSDIAEIQSAPSSAPPVNWGVYSRSIATPGVVDTIKKNYELANKQDDELLKEDTKSKFFNADYQDALKRAQGLQKDVKDQLVELEKKRDAIDEEYDFFLNCSYQQAIDRYPEFVDLVEREFEEEIYEEDGKRTVSHCNYLPEEFEHLMDHSDHHHH